MVFLNVNSKEDSAAINRIISSKDYIDCLMTPEKILEYNYDNDTELINIDRYYKVLASENQPVQLSCEPKKTDRKDTSSEAFITTNLIFHVRYMKNGFVWISGFDSEKSDSNTHYGWLNISDLELINNYIPPKR